MSSRKRSSHHVVSDGAFREFSQAASMHKTKTCKSVLILRSLSLTTEFRLNLMPLNLKTKVNTKLNGVQEDCF